MEFTAAEERDRGSVSELWQECFGDGEPFLSFWFGKVYDRCNTVTAKEGERLCAALQFTEYRLNVCGEAKKAAYICGVGTRTDMRGKGIGSGLLAAAENILKSRGFDFVFLISEADAFYEKAGYVRVCSKTQYRIRPVRVRHTIAVGRMDNKAAAAIYERFARLHGVYIKRDAAEISRLIEEYELYGGAYMLYSGGKPAAYILSDSEDGIMTVEEAAYIGTEGAAAVREFLGTRAEEKVFLRCAAHEPVCKGLGAARQVRPVFAKSLSDFNVKSLEGGYISPII